MNHLHIKEERSIIKILNKGILSVEVGGESI